MERARSRTSSERHEEGQPILVGTVSIEKSELLSGKLNRRGVPHHVLNAKNHEKEAMIVAQAGRKGAVTVATNMAGRGVDILLGGNPEYLARQEMAARDFDNDRYLLFEMDEEERAGYEAEYEPILASSRRRPTRSTTRSSSSAGSTCWAPSGTSRAASTTSCAAVRAARATPASRLFYLSLEDDLMRLFASDRVASIMERLKWPEEEPITAKMVTQRRGERAEADRGAQLRAPQERPEVRRRDEPPARGHLRRAPQDPRGLRLRRQAREMVEQVVRRHRRSSTSRPRSSRRSGTSTRCWSRSPRSTR